MPLAVHLDHVSKRFRLGSQQEYGRLTEAVARQFLRWFRQPTPSAANSRMRDGWFWALENIDLSIESGQIVGIVGRNGAGKSTLLKLLARIITPTQGRVGVLGRVGSLLEVGTGFHPELTGRENVFLNGAILGMSRREIRARFDEIVAFADVHEFLDTPVKHYSSGMAVRLAFSVAAHLEPDVLIIDEVLAVGDQAFQQKCMGKAEELRTQGRTVLLVSHNLASVANLCNRAILLQNGKLVDDGPPSQIIDRYLRESIGFEGIKKWSPEESPATDHYRLHSISVHSHSTEDPPRCDVDIDRDILIRIAYEILKPNTCASVAIRIRDDSASNILWSTNAHSMNLGLDDCFAHALKPGLYQTTCRFPANFFNDRRYFASVSIGPAPGIFEIHEESVISFHVHDTGAMRKEYSGSWQGPSIRPRLEWRSAPLPTSDFDSESSVQP
jgi:lipopolysaccharide transport system ATP-binding protein